MRGDALSRAVKGISAAALPVAVRGGHSMSITIAVLTNTKRFDELLADKLRMPGNR
ncbi:hypothetical protein [Sinomonas sp. B1-1]|uniref:hypothetical protein n=1 Tax=Sinomonas sp. B1-1 TaxID=3141454 RepID=UPI003D2A86BA